ncbi:2-oxo-4-hydroxy-4-carboxy-5-ureidoimidazoline decarboxylase [Paenibacillus tarimensis]
MAISLDDLNGLDRQQFADRLGWIFEHSPWVAERAWAARPFLSVRHLHAAMVREVERASNGEKLALLRAHPDLAARIRMAGASVKEQQGAGLDRLEQEEFDAFASYNSLYKERFGIPFILAVRGYDKTTILEALKERTGSDKETEWGTALQQVARIAQFRLYDHILESGEETNDGK